MSSPLAYSYIRFSHPEQAKGFSKSRQAERTAEWCKRSGATLDTSVTLRDEGVSGFTGQHRTNPDRYALAAFLELAKAGRIPPGSFLVVENLDRLSREDIRPALGLFMSILDAKVHIVQLDPETVFRHDKTDPFDIFRAILELSRGHSESAIKSVRLRDAWARKKAAAVQEKKPLTKLVPAWLSVEDGKFRVVEAKAATVRRIFRMAQDGHGVGVITRKLNADGVPTITGGKHWTSSYVAKLLKSRAVVGEHTSLKYKGKHNVVGSEPPIPNYFPAILSEDDWHATRAAVDSRREKKGRRGAVVTNLFAGLLTDALDSSPIQVISRTGGSRGRQRYLWSYAARLGRGKSIPFPLDSFERAVLSQLAEVDPRTVLPEDKSGDEVLTLTGRRAEIEGRITRIKAALGDGDVEAAVARLRELEAELKDVNAQLAVARQKAASPLAAGWGECQSLLTALDEAPDPLHARTQLRAAFRRIVTGVWCVFAAKGQRRMAAVQMRFEGGSHRDFLILYTRPWAGRSGKVGRRPANWEVKSELFKGDRDRELDLRRPEHAAKIEQVLTSLLAKAKTGLRVTPEERQRIIEMFEQKRFRTEICSELRLGHRTVLAVLVEAGLIKRKKPTPRRKG